MTSSTHPRIAIIGAGPGGLTLARILNLHGIPCAVFEREASSIHRPQGGTLDMHSETGQFAIRAAGLEADFAQVARYEDQASRLADKHGTIVYEDNDPSGNRPEIDRFQLRQLFLDAIPADVIRWDHALLSIEPCPGHTYTLHFADRPALTFDLVVGADGAWSKVRPLVSPTKPIYTGVTFFDLAIDDLDRSHPELAALIGAGKLFALGERKGLLMQRNANSVLRVYPALSIPEDWLDHGHIDFTSAAATKASIAAQFQGWSPALLEFIYQANDLITPRRLYTLPVGHAWTTRPGVTLLGDAAHLMTPFSGEGANLAMRDAADLAHALIGSADWPAAIAAYEGVMVPRAAEAAAGALEALGEVFSEDGLAHSLQQFRSHGAHQDTA